MAGSPSDILSALQNGVQAIRDVANKLTNAFPNTTASSSAAPATLGTIVFTSSQAGGFLLVQTSSGFTAKVPFYPQ